MSGSVLVAVWAVALWAAEVAPEFTAADDPTGVLGVYWVAVVPLIPVLVALATRYNAVAELKLGLSALFALGAAVVSVLGYDWTGATVEVVLLRAGTIFAGAQATFHAANWALASVIGRRFNSVFLPRRGLTGPTALPPADTPEPGEPECLLDLHPDG